MWWQDHTRMKHEYGLRTENESWRYGIKMEWNGIGMEREGTEWHGNAWKTHLSDVISMYVTADMGLLMSRYY